MGDLSNDFSRIEFACRCGCGFDTVDIELIRILQKVRGHFDRRVDITCGCRCKKHNRDVGGADKSKHLLGQAGDFVVEMVPSHVVYAFLDETYPDKYGFGSYEDFTHADPRSARARW